MKTPFAIMTILATLTLGASPVRAQEAPADDTEELKIIQIEIDKAKTAPAPADAKENAAAAAGATPPPEQKPMDFQGLGHLAPFAEVSVLQKKFLPKTGRFHAFVGGTLITNDPYFNTVGAAFKLGYFFTESFGVELNYFGMSTSEAKATQELSQIQNVNTDSLVLTKSFTAADIVWVPMYGKMTWFNDRIIPFDLYFSLGGGSTTTQTESAGTIHFGTGQIFASTKSSAFRWDFSWNFFNATGIDGKKSAYNNLFLTVGWGWFFPEAKYR